MSENVENTTPPDTAAPESAAPDTASPETPAKDSASTDTPAADTPAEKSAAPVAVEEAPVEEKPKAPAPKLPKGQHWWWGTGRRKTAVARVRVRPGNGIFQVNDRDVNKYFTEERDRNDVNGVLEKTNTASAIDIYVKVHGGGYMGQAGAIVLGLGRALKRYDETLEPILRSNNFLTRDDRQVERKKPGQKGARARFQFSKR